MRRIMFCLALALLLVVTQGSVALAQPAPEFKLGFKALADQIPAVVGQPLDDEHWAANGDSLQQTSTGLMVWRKADNWTAFTNGSRTWINGPYGVQDRGNDERFEWESPAVTPQAATLGLDLVSLTSPVQPGATATLSARTAPDADCTITVYYQSGPSTAAGLEPKAADASGNVSWSWTVGSRTTPGTWRIVVTASQGGNTVTRETTFDVR